MMDNDQAQRILRNYGLKPGDTIPPQMRSKPQAWRHVTEALATLAPKPQPESPPTPPSASTPTLKPKQAKKARKAKKADAPKAKE